MKKKKILITGANGYIGLLLTHLLIQKGWYVIGIDQQSHHLTSISHENFSFFQVDLTKIDSFNEGFRDVDVLIHCAALVHGKSQDLSRENYFKINVTGTKNILQFLDPQQLKHVLFISTISVYGDLYQGNQQKGLKLQPLDFYGESKLAAEESVREYSEKNQVPFVIFRLSPVYGPGFLFNLNKRIYLPGKYAFYKLGKGEQRLSLFSVNNILEVVSHSIDNKNFSNRTYVLKDPEDYPVKEIIRIFKKRFSHQSKPVFRIPVGICLWMFKVLKIVIPKKGQYYLYQFRKISTDALIPDEESFVSHDLLKWNLENTLFTSIKGFFR